jgi:hypothetical protein
MTNFESMKRCFNDRKRFSRHRSTWCLNKSRTPRKKTSLPSCTGPVYGTPLTKAYLYTVLRTNSRAIVRLGVRTHQEHQERKQACPVVQALCTTLP